MIIRPIALGAIRRGDDLLVYEAVDRVKQVKFYRPLGGGIEFGERAEDALRREFQEELGAELADIGLIGVLENIFHANGKAGHEVVFVFAAELAESSWYERDDLGTVRDSWEPVFWRPLAGFTAGEAKLYPSGLLSLLGIAG